MSSHRDSVQEDIARMSADIFGPEIPTTNYPQDYPQNYFDSSSQMPPPNYPQPPQNYQRRDQMLQTNYQQNPQTGAPYYTSNDPNIFIPQESHQLPPPYAYGGTSSVASSSQLNPPISGTPSTSVTEIQEEGLAPPPPIVPRPPQQPAAKKARRPPEYNQYWFEWYDVTKDDDGYLKTLYCKVDHCKKPYFVYKQASGMSSFKRHVDVHIRKGENYNPNNTPQIQTQITPDGTLTNPKFDEKRMLSELARYITHKAQPISMGGCTAFARLVIRGCAQPMYKRMHHRKLVGEIKKQFTTIKDDLKGTFAYQSNKVSITSDIWTAGKHGLGYSCITGHWIDD